MIPIARQSPNFKNLKRKNNFDDSKCNADETVFVTGVPWFPVKFGFPIQGLFEDPSSPWTEYQDESYESKALWSGSHITWATVQAATVKYSRLMLIQTRIIHIFS